MRPYLNSLATGLDLILIARAPLVTATLQETRAALNSLLRRAKILPTDES
jgi:RNase P protein component